MRRRCLHARYKHSLHQGESIPRRASEFLRFDPQARGRLIQVERSRRGKLEPSSEGVIGRGGDRGTIGRAHRCRDRRRLGAATGGRRPSGPRPAAGGGHRRRESHRPKSHRPRFETNRPVARRSERRPSSSELGERQDQPAGQTGITVRLAPWTTEHNLHNVFNADLPAKIPISISEMINRT
jgi:hypothetical protein